MVDFRAENVDTGVVAHDEAVGDVGASGMGMDGLETGLDGGDDGRREERGTFNLRPESDKPYAPASIYALYIVLL